MDFLEKDLEDILYQSNQSEIQSRGLHYFNYNKLYRQVRLGNYGIADLISFKRYESRTNRFVIYELKNKILNAAAFWQLVRYIKGLTYFLYKHDFNINNCEIIGVMIGREIDLNSDFCYLPTISSKIRVYTYDYKLDGIKFTPLLDTYTLNNSGELNIKSLGYNSKMDFLRDLMQEPLDPQNLPF